MADPRNHDGGASSHGKCLWHEDHAVVLDRLERGHDAMDKRVTVLEDRSYSPAVVVAVIGLLGTVVTAAGGVLATVLIMVAKTNGWM